VAEGVALEAAITEHVPDCPRIDIEVIRCRGDAYESTFSSWIRVAMMLLHETSVPSCRQSQLTRRRED